MSGVKQAATCTSNNTHNGANILVFANQVCLFKLAFDATPTVRQYMYVAIDSKTIQSRQSLLSIHFPQSQPVVVDGYGCGCDV
eukprot:m.29321 g.29321  ORF g.29321 m.29321 type:complete len:83 (+) comp9150_c0_seq1:2546-2794(+)